MRPSSYSSDPSIKPNWRIVKALIPYLLAFKWRIFFAFTLLILAKLASVATPWVLKLIVDDLDLNGAAVITVPTLLLLGYGALRFCSSFLGELRDTVFARVTERAMRLAALDVFRHLHQLDLDFHLSRKTGGLSRDIERGTSGISFLLRFLLFNIIPTVFELLLVFLILLSQFTWVFSAVVVLSIAVYIVFSVLVTEWRSQYIREVNELDNRSNTRAVDSLLNYETVKYFNNEDYEAREYDRNLMHWEQSRIKIRVSLSALNSGQALIVALSVTVIMLLASHSIVAGEISIGDFVMINAYLIQLFVPLNFLGFVYREIRQALINIERMFQLLAETPKIQEAEDAVELSLADSRDCTVEFSNIHFGYSAEREILKGISFTVNSGEKVAIVGSSGAGKSTLAKLLFRFYDPSAGVIRINGQDIRGLKLDSLRRLIGVVPQDTVLFNDTLYYNIAYGAPDQDPQAVYACAERAHLAEFILKLPDGYQTQVGERGLKVSGGEKQRLAIARVLLKNPPILLFDEATSALDTRAEQIITRALDDLAVRHTTIVIAHRLSTILNADRILVLNDGQLVESGSHGELLAAGGYYAQLWAAQAQEEMPRPVSAS